MRSKNFKDIQGELFPDNGARGRANRDNAINQVVTHADELCEDWSEQAFNFLVKFLDTIEINVEFMTEDVRFLSDGIVPVPHKLRAWGAIPVRAAKEGIIKRVRYKPVKDPTQHAGPASVWVKTELYNVKYRRYDEN